MVFPYCHIAFMSVLGGDSHEIANVLLRTKTIGAAFNGDIEINLFRASKWSRISD